MGLIKKMKTAKPNMTKLSSWMMVFIQRKRFEISKNFEIIVVVVGKNSIIHSPRVILEIKRVSPDT